MNFDGLIFDLDGTLWDSSLGTADAMTRAYAKCGIEKRVSQEFIRSISGKPSDECDALLLDGVPETLKGELSQIMDIFEIQALEEFAQSALYRGVEEGLLRLKDHYQLYLVSNCGERYLETFHKYTSIGSLFADSECFGRTKRLKFANIESIVTRCKLKAPCYIGDTSSDEEAARNATVPFFHAQYGFGKPLGNYHGFKNFDELTDYFLSACLEKNLRF